LTLNLKGENRVKHSFAGSESAGPRGKEKRRKRALAFGASTANFIRSEENINNHNYNIILEKGKGKWVVKRERGKGKVGGGNRSGKRAGKIN